MGDIIRGFTSKESFEGFPPDGTIYVADEPGEGEVEVLVVRPPGWVLRLLSLWGVGELPRVEPGAEPTSEPPPR